MLAEGNDMAPSKKIKSKNQKILLAPYPGLFMFIPYYHTNVLDHR